MHISRLALDHYRSWSQVVVDFVPGVNILVGKNGLGKTNLVEAVEVLSTGASHRASSMLPLIERGQTTATIRANLVDDDGQSTTYEASIHARGANRARINQEPRSIYAISSAAFPAFRLLLKTRDWYRVILVPGERCSTKPEPCWNPAICSRCINSHASASSAPRC